ncbi:hypothetical protein H072_5067 [Dactylellina haptotyla CBS 200.50]|uniref:SHSP domain-containing protein n=1 Tax=Dactylellina haptotyla (strain CBS 200.50) TaxID=1284197 RepID=S8ADK7_DACHA|nr:hypothetical protein H072_5067 [Dactylellina haptotyla CBS 200.50]
MAPSNPQSPPDQVMDFISNLGEHMEEAFSNADSHTEKGEPSEKATHGNPPEYAQSDKDSEKAGESSAHANRGSGDRRERQWGPWGGNWREQGQNPWAGMGAAMGDMFNASFGPNGAFNPGNFGPASHGHPMFGGPGGCRGRGGFGGRGNYHGPWGWGGHRGRWAHGHRGGCHKPNNDQEFIPAVDLFDTPDSFVVHVALPGALKEDIGINYDFDNSELQVSGVVHRPGDEEFQKHLVDGERRVGAFDRKIKLESNGKSVPVDADAITAKLENGLLEVTVPKMRKADEPEKKKINIE